jgi:hypothetical protein
MNRRQLIIGGLAAAAAASVGPVQARERDQHGPHEHDPREHDPRGHCPHAQIVGSWFGVVDGLLNGAPIGSFNDLLSIQRDGIVVESRRYVVTASPVGPLVETTGHGAWKEREDGSFELFFRVIMERQNGAQFGTDNIRLVISHDHATDTLSGNFESEIKDLNDNVLMSFSGTYSATRIAV